MCVVRRVARRTGLVTAMVIAVSCPALAGPKVTGVRIGDYPAKTRFVVELSAPLKFTIFTLADPYRVVIDLPEVEWAMGRDRTAHGGVITDFRYGLFRAGTARIVLDVKAPVRVSKSFLLKRVGSKPDRLVIDLKRIERVAFVRALRDRRARARPGQTPVRPVAKPPRRRNAKPMIAIDPGHGGVDPGTTGVSGVREKYIVLAHARELRRQLLATGRYRVAMTRNRDVFVRLRDRIAKSRQTGADIFISLHADSLRNRRVRGGSIYTLSEKASDTEAGALAAKENKADVIAGVDLNVQSPEVANILIDLAQRETMNESAVFARRLTAELSKSVRLLRNTHRFADFAVLKAPDVPSVLVELGYLSNRSDEKLLRQKRHRRRVAAAIVRAINGYFARQQVFKRP